MGSLPKACTASQWSRAPGASRRISGAASSTGKMAPVSLLTIIMLTSTVSGRSAASRAAADTQPLASGVSRVISQPSFSSAPQAAATEGCSIAVVMICRPARFFAAAAPKTARLLASVPPEVKVMVSGAAPSSPATVRRAASNSCSASKPAVWREEGFPQHAVIISYALSAA